MGRDEDPVVLVLRGLEESREVLDGVVLLDAVADQPQETPFSLRTSFCGSMTTSAVSAC